MIRPLKLLDEEIRRLVEIEFEMARKGIPSFKGAGQGEFRIQYNIKNENDFALGWAIGSIQSGFLLHYYGKFNKLPTGEEEMEMVAMLKKKAKELQDFCNAV